MFTDKERGMKVLIDADVVLYLAVSRNKEETLEDGIRHFKGVIKDVQEHHFVEPEDVELYFSSDGENFRKNDYPVYKSNRKGKEPPPFMKEIKKHFMDTDSRAVGSPRGEADDYLLIRAAELEEKGERWVVATVDKDLMTMPGRFYNLRTQESLSKTDREAYTFMVQQFVMGDSVDGIGGLKGWGKVKTTKLINEKETVYANFEKAKQIWEENYGQGWEEKFDETANLAFIRRREVDLLPLEFHKMSPEGLCSLLRLPVSD